MIRLCYPRSSDNVGDELNAWLWPALLGDIRHDTDIELLGIGNSVERAVLSAVARRATHCRTGYGGGLWCASAIGWALDSLRLARPSHGGGSGASGRSGDCGYGVPAG